jgi:hypothetical protein
MVADATRDIFGGAALCVVLVISITGLIFPRKFQDIAISLSDPGNPDDRDHPSRMSLRMRYVRSDFNLWNIRVAGAIGLIGCLFVLWMIVKNSLHLGN